MPKPKTKPNTKTQKTKKTKNTGKAKIAKKSKELIPKPEDLDSDRVLTGLIAEAGEDRMLKYITYTLWGLPHYQAALKAGYAPHYAQSALRTNIKTSKKWRAVWEEFNRKAPETYRQTTRALLPRLSVLDQKIVAELEADPKLAIQKPGMLKQLKQCAGVLEPDGTCQQFTYVANIQQLISAGYMDGYKNIEAEDAEFTEVEEDDNGEE